MTLAAPTLLLWWNLNTENKNYNISRPLAFKSQREWYQSKTYFITISSQKSAKLIHSWDTADFRVSWTKRPWSFLTTPTQKSLDQLLASLYLFQRAKNQFIPSVHFWDTVNSEFHDQTGHIHLPLFPPQNFLINF